MANNGWIKLHRCFLEWEWFEDANMVKCYIWLLLNAKNTDGRWQGISLKRGQVVTSYSVMSRELKMSVRNLRTIFAKLESTGEVTRQWASKYSIITLCNFDKYQASTIEERQASDKQSDKQATSKATSKTTNKTTNEIESYEDVAQAKRQADIVNTDKQSDNINKNNKEDKNIVVVDARTHARERLIKDLHQHRIMLEQFCLTERITETQFFQFAEAIFAEWDFVGEDYTDLIVAKKHLLNTLRIKASEARKEAQAKQRNKRSSLNDDDNLFVNEEWKD